MSLFIPSCAALNVCPTQFTPKSVAGLGAWLDATSLASITKDGSNLVSAWTDLSGNGYSVSQSAGANKPTYVASAINGKPAISFVEASLLYFSGNGLNLLRNRTGFSIFMVAKTLAFVSGGSTRYLLFFSTNSSSRTRLDLAWSDMSEIRMSHEWRRLDADSLGSAMAPIGNAFTAGSSNVISTIADFSAGTLKTYKNTSASPIISSTTTTGATSNTATVEGTIGASGGVTAVMYVGEVAIYTAAVSATDHAKLFDYFKRKWGIS